MASPTTLPKISLASPKTATVDSSQPPQLPSELVTPPVRLNVLQPAPPDKRTVALETEDPHWHNHARTSRMQERQYATFHNGWSRPLYGSPVGREGYRKNIRETLKFQMAEREKQSRQSNRYKVLETRTALHNDEQSHTVDVNSKVQKLEYLKQFRDDNKRLMELREEQKKIQVVIDHSREREILRYNPINWSCTLK